jgi:hypothetical protein
MRRLTPSVICLLFLSCASREARLEKAPRPVNRQEEAASTHVSVLSVARWEEFAEALQPTFNLTADKALVEAVPATMRLEEKLVDAFLARLKLAPPTSSSTAATMASSTGSSSTTNGATSAVAGTNDSSSTTTNEGSGNVASATNQTFTPPQASSLGPATSVLAGDIALDPMTRYRAATALFQEVQIINRYIRDAAVRRNSVPFVVRLQVSLLPVLRAQAYDASTTFAFFSGGTTPTAPPFPNARSAPRDFLSNAVASLAQEAPTVSKTGEPLPEGQRVRKQLSGGNKQPDSYQCGIEQEAPTVVPLLVTDSLENSLHSRSLAVLRDFGLALNMLNAGFGAGLDVQRQRSQVATLVGNDLNSLLTVGRVADNALRVRLGAAQQADARYAMVPQTHSITVLVLVPRSLMTACKPWAGLRLLSRTDVTDSIRGITLRGRTELEATALLNDVKRLYKIPDVDMTELLAFAQKRDQAGFMKALGDKVTYPESIWLDVVSVMIGGRYAPAEIELPEEHNPDLLQSQAATVFDNTKDASTITLAGGKDLLASQLTANLNVTKDAKAFTLPAAKIEILNSGRGMRLTFASLVALGLAKAGDSPVLELRIRRDGPAWADQSRKFNDWVVRSATLSYLAAAPPEAPKTQAVAELSTSSAAIVSEKGSGTIQVLFKINDASKRPRVSVGGADVSAIKSTPEGVLLADAEGWTLTKAGTVAVTLTNLVPGNTVTFTLIDEKKSVGELKVPIK